ncbi:MAG: hypothetical protein WCR20_06020 [Verrucomicrobiota bacterium]
MMTETDTLIITKASLEEIQLGWNELKLRLGQLEAERTGQATEIKNLRTLLDTVVAHRQKSHNELVMMLTNLVSKLNINDVGVIVSRLMEHTNNVNNFLSAIVKDGIEAPVEQPQVLKTLEQTKRDLATATQAAAAKLIQLSSPLEPAMLSSLEGDPELFFKPPFARARRGFIKTQIPRERVVREFGESALPFFADMTTDAKLNPHPKPDEIMLGFRREFPELIAQDTTLPEEKRRGLNLLFEQVQTSRAATPDGRAQRNAFQSLSFVVELRHYYDNQATEAPDVAFAQRLPSILEYLVQGGTSDLPEEALIRETEQLLGMVINPDHRQMIVNNVGKGGGPGATSRFVLRLRMPKTSDFDQTIVDFIRHLIPPLNAPPVATFVQILRLVSPEMQMATIKAILHTDRIRRSEAEELGEKIGEAFGLKGLADQLRADQGLSPELERQLAWVKIKQMISSRNDPGMVAAAFRDRLTLKYDGDELRQSWVTLTEADPMSLIRIFCHLPYLPDGATASIARPIMETYVTRLTHEKYASTYNKIVNSLRNMYQAKPDSPTLQSFLALVRWVDATAAGKICTQVGIPTHPG